MKTQTENDANNSLPTKDKRDWLALAMYLMGIAACLSAGGGITKGAAIYCAIVFVTKGRDGIFGKSHNAELSHGAIKKKL